MGAPKGNKNRAKDNKFPRRMVSLSGPEYDAAMERLARRGKSTPTNKEILREMSDLDWSQFEFNLSDEEAAEIEREAEMRKLRADCRWIKDCERLSIEALKEVVERSEKDYHNPVNLRRHRQAQIILEGRLNER